MKKILIATVTFILFSATISCQKEVIAEKGGIDVISNVYFDVSKGLDKMQTFHLSKLNYSGKNIIELIPNNEFTEITSAAYFISDSICFKLNPDNISRTTLSEIKKLKGFPVTKKEEGTLFLKEEIPNYKNRKNLSDTVLFKKKYKRFEVNSPWSYTRFYIVATDTILPYSMYKHAEKDYGGRLERIDSYNKKEDIFVTLQLIPRKKWDSEAKDFFTFNQYLKKNAGKK